MKNNREINQQVLNTSVDKKGRPTIYLDKRKSIYESVTEALRAIPVTNRNVGLTVPIYNGIKVVEYWWEKGIKDSDFVEKINGDDIPRINTKLIDLQNQIDGINNIEFKVFDSLPELGDSSIIYVIPNTVSEEDDDFIEYFWIKSQQRYERFGGLNVDGGVTINNFYTFDSNVFSIDEESDIKKVSLNNKRISIGNDGINIYKLNVGEINNELQVNIDRINYNINNISYGGGRVILHGYYNQTGYDSKIYTTSLNYDAIDVNYEEGNMSYRSTLTSTNLRITDNDSKEINISKDGIEYETNNGIIFEMNDSKFRSVSNKVLIKATGDNGFNINYNDEYGIEAYKISESIGMGVNIFTDNSRIALRSNTITLESSKVSATNLYLTDTQGSIQKGFEALYDTSYTQLSAGIKATCSVWVQNTDLFGLRSTDNYSRTLLRLNDIVYRKSTTASTYGTSIISWNENINKYPELKLGWENQIQILEDRIKFAYEYSQLNLYENYIDIENGDARIRINNQGECGFYTAMDTSIKILNNGDIKLQQIYNHIDVIDSDNIRKILIESGYGSNKGFVQLKADSSYIIVNGGVDGDYEIRMYASNGVVINGSNNSSIGIDNDGWCFMKGNFESKMYIDGYNNTYISVEKDEDWNTSKIYLQQGTNNYITLYKNDSDENYINVRTENFTFKDGSNNILFTINSDGDYNWNLSNQFKWSLGDNKYVRIVATGIEYFDGTNTYTKTWAQIFS